MELIQTKSLLAKLMASENLHIEQRNVVTASFDVENRILTVPILDKDITAVQYDLFMGHEVGHALYTPLDGLKKAFDMKLSMSVMNVLEDSRIERKIKQKYPGIRQSFIRAYKELMEKDFFGTADTDLNTLNFIDRVNLYCKGGIDTGIMFSDEEKTLLEEVESTVTYDDVIEVCKKVSQYMKDKGEIAPSDTKLEGYIVGPDDSDSDEPYEEVPISKEEMENLKDSFRDAKSEGSEGDKESGTDAKNENKQNGQLPDQSGSSVGTGREGGDVKSAAKEPVSHTDEAWHKNQNRLFSKDARRFAYGNVPDIDLNEAIVDHKELWKRHSNAVDDFFGKETLRYNKASDPEALRKFRNDSKKVVSYLVKEFELRKNAEQMKRTSIAKTGELNMSKIYSYNFSEDIFKRMSIVPNGKSHGLIMFIDWSGSMSDYMDNTIRQLLNLVMFCKKVNVPYEVYAFTQSYYEGTDVYGKGYRVTPKAGDMVLSEFTLMNLLSSRMSNVEYNYAASVLIAYGNRYGYKPDWFRLSGTPLNEAVVAAMKIVPKFQKERKLQIVNTVFLTDGDGSKNNSMYDSSGRWLTLRGNEVVIIRDPVTKQEEILEEYPRARDMTKVYIKLLKARTNCHVVGFYILGGRDFAYYMRDFFQLDRSDVAELEQLKKEFRGKKYKVVTSDGYDEYYLLRAEGLDTDEDAEFEVAENATTRGFVSAFAKFTNNRKANRVVLNRFIGVIA
jgi:hypothetical protein